MRNRSRASGALLAIGLSVFVLARAAAAEDPVPDPESAEAAEAPPPLPPPPPPPPLPPPASGDIWSRAFGPATVRLMDFGFDVMAAAGFSNQRNDVIETLEGGNHDPRQRGFTLQQVELAARGAVDPYFTGDVVLVYFLDPDGESQFEVEEAYATTQQLPFRLDEYGFQIQAGTFFTDFGRINHQHAHVWRWQDAPVVLSRFMGEDGLRGPGFRIGWLTPLPWYSELSFGMQNANGETQVSFNANQEVFDERAIGGRPFVDGETRSTRDFTYLVRWANGIDLGDSISSEVGASVVFGPNPTGQDGNTQIFGADFVAKWRPETSARGWPFVVTTGEIMFRRYHADGFPGGRIDGERVPELSSDTLQDWGLYLEAVWGFVRPWAVGLRWDYAQNGGGPSYDPDEDYERIGANQDPYRSRRHRISPLLIFQPSEFSRIRLQFNYDRALDVPSNNAYSVWLGLEFSLGAHAAHEY